MNDSWRDFLTSKDAIFVEDTNIRFDIHSTAELKSTIISPVHWMGVARVRGADAEAFLQAQFTGDVEGIEPYDSVLSGYCDPKGRLLAIFRVIRDGTDFLLLTDSEILPDVVQRLRMYILRMNVELTMEESHVTVGIAGPNAREFVTKLTERTSQIKNFAAASHNVVTISSPTTIPRYLVVAKPSQIIDAWPRTRDEATLVGSAEWTLLEIRSGLARITPNTQQLCIPQSVNLDLVGGISFSKGCYPGQEIVARVRYLGRIKQRMARTIYNNSTVPKPGDPIFSGINDNKRVGIVINAVGMSDNTGEMLATVSSSSTVGSQLSLDPNGDRKVRLVDFPTKNEAL